MYFSKESSLTYDHIEVGSDAFLIGYPLSLGLSGAGFDASRPLLRRATIAGKNSANKTIIVDGAVYKGNSGGPILEMYKCGDHCKKNHYVVIGVVSQFIPFTQIWTNAEFGTSRSDIENSGYSVIVPLDKIYQLVSSKDFCKRA